MPRSLDISQNRRAQKWTTRELIGRVAWAAIRKPLFAWTPRPFWGWRRTILRLFGARIGRDVRVFPSVRIAIPWNVSIGDFSAVGNSAILYALGPITIGDQVTISQYAHLCAGTHDFDDPSMTLMKPPISVESEAWICADAFIGPGVTIGERSIVAARAVVVKDVASNTIVGGNPARILKPRATL
jgi:putative colanic acid biosynthesis acetyltransferase WcaF